MDPDDPQPIRFRVVLELTVPDADPGDPSNYDQFLEQLKKTLENSKDLNCKDVLLRASKTISSKDKDADWRDAWKYDFQSFSPRAGYIFGTTYPVPAVDPTDLSRVWNVLSKAEAGELEDVNIAVAIGQVLRPESNAQAVIARTCVLRVLQARNAVPIGASDAIFEKAAGLTIERPVVQDSDLELLARSFSF